MARQVRNIMTQLATKQETLRVGSESNITQAASMRDHAAQLESEAAVRKSQSLAVEKALGILVDAGVAV